MNRVIPCDMVLKIKRIKPCVKSHRQTPHGGTLKREITHGLRTEHEQIVVDKNKVINNE